MARLIYSFFLYILSPLVFLHLWLRGKKAPEYRKRWAERLAFYNAHFKPDSLVIHCASVGELMAASKLIHQLKDNYSITLTCNTPTGSAEIQKQFGNTLQHVYLPLDFPCAIGRFFKALKPKAIIILETELWPNLIIKAQQQHIPVCVINARLSEKSLKGYQRILPLSKQIMRSINLLAAHNKEDSERFLQLGLPSKNSKITGSIKFDIELNTEIEDRISAFKPQLSSHDFIWVAGSTHPGEYEQVINAHLLLLEKKPNALLIIAPRHPEQFNKVADYLKQNNISFSQRSKEKHTGQSVLLADTMGEMLVLFGAADCAFIGGSLIARGGHNPLEAAAFNIPILTGPSYTNFLHVYPQLISNNACICVDSSKALFDNLLSLANDAEKRHTLGNNAYQILETNRGALKHTIALIENEISHDTLPH
ncbi:lipid IV(A) 3-deoxy-D-manno-octulosonic acid transferase [Pseudoalteromonas sp.]|uniref:lipid IV(A) 3-deoxy-D-manno-octulosonic acid transferase n=1 Tax=Pseudoalteromonas sp. TaxID=53249 RepID=UPI00356631A0